jgi:flavoprotein hydroxylase
METLARDGDWEVTVVGCGPVGAVVAIPLGQRDQRACWSSSATPTDTPNRALVPVDRMAEFATITVLRDRAVVDLTHDETGAQVTSSTADGSVRRARGRYVIGCDGANSFLRQNMDSATHDLGFFFDGLIVDLIFDEPGVFDPDNLSLCAPRRPTSAVSGARGSRRWEFMRLPADTYPEIPGNRRHACATNTCQQTE